MVEVNCNICNKLFKSSLSRIKKGWGKCCSHKCSGEFLKRKNRVILKCENCGKEKSVLKYRIKKGKKFCSRKCHYEYRKKVIKENHPLWRGGKYVNSLGYVSINLGGNNNHRLEHDLVMENYIGRKLLKEEVVHHINGKKDDNRIENLLLMNRAEHTEMHKLEGKTND